MLGLSWATTIAAELDEEKILNRTCKNLITDVGPENVEAQIKHQNKLFLLYASSIKGVHVTDVSVKTAFEHVVNGDVVGEC